MRALVLFPDTREDRKDGVHRCVSFSGEEGSEPVPNTPSSFWGLFYYFTPQSWVFFFFLPDLII